jgi:hypothetical protein
MDTETLMDHHDQYVADILKPCCIYTYIYILLSFLLLLLIFPSSVDIKKIIMILFKLITGRQFNLRMRKVTHPLISMRHVCTCLLLC